MTLNPPQITYYDIDRLDRLSFYLSGFQLNHEHQRCRFKVVQRPPKFFAGLSASVEWQQYTFSGGIFKYKSSEEEFYFCIDRGDHSTNKMREGYVLPLLKKVRYYFKTNYSPEAIQADPELRAQQSKIVPILPSFPIRIHHRRSFIPRRLPWGGLKGSVRRIKDRIRHLMDLPTLSELRQYRTKKRDLDVFLVLFNYYKPHQRQMAKIRNQIIRALRARPHLNAEIGFVGSDQLPEDLADLLRPRIAMRSYLESLARSKVAIYVRGPHDGISSKFGQLLAMGKPIVGESLAINRERLYGLPDFDLQFNYDDPEALVDRVDALLQQPEEMERLSRSNAEVFDSLMMPESVVEEVLSVLDNRAEAHAEAPLATLSQPATAS